MPEKTYRFRYKVATVITHGHNQKEARYNAELAYHYWRTTGKHPSNGAYNGAKIEVHSDD